MVLLPCTGFYDPVDTNEKQHNDTTAFPPYYFFRAFTCVVTACNGEVKNDLPKENVIEPKIILAGQLKLVKTQGSQKGRTVGRILQTKQGTFGSVHQSLYKYDGKSFSLFTVKMDLTVIGFGVFWKTRW
jgi:hypothetical protein